MMVDGYGALAVAPVVVTIGLWLVIVGVSAAVVSTTVADLVGLLTLPAVPVVYRVITDRVGDVAEEPADEMEATPAAEIRTR